MNRLRLLALAVALALIAAAPKVVPPMVGQQAPDFTLLDQASKPTKLSAARGHKVVLVFYRGYW
jgi:cytochrome oxidase Cu insertion factor (SCO1/SenC/PrrC family)